jgi:2-oxoglutarate dehydrogenase complex dehydrogenase (E1) component-like enzyme
LAALSPGIPCNIETVAPTNQKNAETFSTVLEKMLEYQGFERFCHKKSKTFPVIAQ